MAFASFSEDMKKAVFEVIFFLHVNDPKYEEHVFRCPRLERIHGVLKEVEVEETTTLYLKDSPAGVVGIEKLSPIFREQFNAYVSKELDDAIATDPSDSAFRPIYSIASLGSIGTVGHKKTASDLDLQVQYELEPFLVDCDRLSDEAIATVSQGLIDFFAQKYGIKKGLTKKEMKSAQIRSELSIAGHTNFKRHFQIVYEIFVLNKRSLLDRIFAAPKHRQRVVHEIVELIKLYSKTCLRKELIKRDRLLKRRIALIQDYIGRKFPKADVYLFAYSNDDYRDGKHGTTLESKEASGTAYELILNYETLMPGIQFTPVIPVHFLMPDSINSSRSKYEQIVDYIRFDIISIYDAFKIRLVDLGSTPPLTTEYMTAHSGAMYWESFKASSGNLPKALLRLLRYEMLCDERFNASIIELIKNPHKLDRFAGNVVAAAVEGKEAVEEKRTFVEDEPNFFDDYGIENPLLLEDDKPEYDPIGLDENASGFPIAMIFKTEEKFPQLLQDPWWLNYKALKIGFGPENRTIADQREKDTISRIVDLGFALHIKISDVFLRYGERKKFETFRELFLAYFLEKAFPRKKRRFLEHVCNGDVDAVILFEKDMKQLFKNSMARIQAIVDRVGGKNESNQEEFNIWHHYYQQNFEPPPNVIHRDILSHLRVPRGRLQIGFNKKGSWFFKSLQKSNLNHSRYDTFGQLDHLPDQVDLLEHKSFLHGIAHCMMNDYYGVLNKGTLLESRTHLEFSLGQMAFGSRAAKQFAYVRPDIVVRLVDRINIAFPPQEIDFRDCIKKEREVADIFILLNLFNCGRLSFLYRDVLKTWYVDECDHPELEQYAQECYEEENRLLQSRLILDTVKKFFKRQAFELNRETRSRVHYWVNPNSVRTHHAMDNFVQKELDLAKKFGSYVFHALAGRTDRN